MSDWYNPNLPYIIADTKAHDKSERERKELQTENAQLRELLESVTKRLEEHCCVLPDIIAQRLTIEARAVLEGK